VFCRVVDNYGDAAVCWRLARELAARGTGPVRLLIDALAVLQPLCPAVDAQAAAQRVDGVDILRWDEAVFGEGSGEGADAGPRPGVPADIAVEGFGCGLPHAYAEAMAARSPASLWITLEYLSAEPWVVSHHGLPSPHPRLPLARYFYFPGFTAATGGLLKESGLDARREAFLADPQARNAFWQARGFAAVVPDAFTVSLFGYENAAVAGLLDAWSNGAEPVVVALPPGRLRPQVLAHCDAADAGDGGVIRRGNLELRLLPFLPQADYDELLWACDWNFVRGEDSFVRAQWAARPLVWHIYPQAGQAHWVKLDAFLDHWCAGLAAEPAAALRRLWHAWNGVDGQRGEEDRARDACGVAWAALARHRPALACHAQKWAKELDFAGNLAEKLAQFCIDRLESPAS
jgi:uncharacterized repeat protein (TIGR03837 family)